MKVRSAHFYKAGKELHLALGLIKLLLTSLPAPPISTLECWCLSGAQAVQLRECPFGWVAVHDSFYWHTFPSCSVPVLALM